MKKFAIALAVAGVALMLPEMAAAGDLKATMIKTSTNVGSTMQLITYVAYIVAAVFIITGLLKLKAHMDKPDQNPLRDAIARLLVGGLLGILPVMVDIVRASTTGSSGTASLVTFGAALT
jgi:RsiW-degrading membrane proteinase PrsW (M82 family)